MPVDIDEEFANSSSLSEHMKIKIGEKGAGERAAPKKYEAPVISFPVKGKAGVKFDVNEEVMEAIKKDFGSTAKGLIKSVPVFLMSDDIDQFLYVYRAIYNASNRAMCKSNMGEAKAQRWFQKTDPGEDKGKRGLGKSKNLFILNQPIEIDCDRKCSFWLKNGEKGECSWHAVLSVQLQHSAVYPQMTKYRTSGWKVMTHLRSSLNQIKDITGGVLAGIPLHLVQIEIESKTAAGEKRKHPVMEFQWHGTITELREAAVAELNSRRRLKASHEGKHVELVEDSRDAGVAKTSAVKLNDTGHDGGDSTPEIDDDDFVDFDDEDVKVVDAPVAEKSLERNEAVSALELKVEELKKVAGVTPRAFESMSDKCGGDLNLIHEELKKLTSSKKSPDAVDDDDGFMDFEMGDESNESSETVAKAEEEEKARAAKKAEAEKLEAAAAASAKVVSDVKAKERTEVKKDMDIDDGFFDDDSFGDS